MNLDHFTGSETRYRYGPLSPRALLTEGAQYLAQEARCFWLMDEVALRRPWTQDDFVVVRLTPVGQGALLVMDNGNDGADRREYARVDIPWADFPFTQLSEVKLYVCWDGQYATIMLPGEY